MKFYTEQVFYFSSYAELQMNVEKLKLGDDAVRWLWYELMSPGKHKVEVLTFCESWTIWKRQQTCLDIVLSLLIPHSVVFMIIFCYL